MLSEVIQVIPTDDYKVYVYMDDNTVRLYEDVYKRQIHLDSKRSLMSLLLFYRPHAPIFTL